MGIVNKVFIKRDHQEINIAPANYFLTHGMVVFIKPLEVVRGESIVIEFSVEGKPYIQEKIIDKPRVIEAVDLSSSKTV